jgi:cytochrome P450
MAGRINIMSPEVRANPYPVYAALRRDHPVTEVEPGGMWAVSRYEDVLFIIKNPQLFSSEGFKSVWQLEWTGYNPIANSMIVMDGPAHTQLRQLVNRAFGGSAISGLQPRLLERAHQLTEELAARGEVDAVSQFTLPLPAFVIGELLGLDTSLHTHFKRWSDDILSITPVPEGPEHVSRVRTTIADLSKYLNEVIASRRREPREDLVTHLTQAEAEGQRLSDTQIVDFLVLLLIAGLETTAHLLSNSLLLLSERPDILGALRADLSLVPAFVEEMLRYDPPTYAVPRMTTSEVELRGVRLPPGAVVLNLIGSANRDESHYTDPDRFDLHRQQPSLSFGHGIHFCVGAHLARLEARVGLEALVSRFHGLVRPPGESTWNRALTARGLVALPMRFLSA